nr:MAG TPA: hypothetical protein [Caudoviricetes sp.]
MYYNVYVIIIINITKNKNLLNHIKINVLHKQYIIAMQ